MEIPEIILKKIDNEIKSGNKNRNIILRKVISESKDLTTILNYCKNMKSEEDIVIEARININKVRKGIKIIHELSKVIDSQIYRAQNSRQRTINNRNKLKLEQER